MLLRFPFYDSMNHLGIVFLFQGQQLRIALFIYPANPTVLTLSDCPTNSQPNSRSLGQRQSQTWLARRPRARPARDQIRIACERISAGFLWGPGPRWDGSETRSGYTGPRFVGDGFSNGSSTFTFSCHDWFFAQTRFLSIGILIRFFQGPLQVLCPLPALFKWL